ncbi:unnamed protein product [Rotaria socialis]|uniref:Endonuclease/exonuclease/phosphatase domain-containing protein n=1 Tax=Rotaria socialis TaxID=392032 RepID=A0A820REP1_9BILA|nr:unnamed protein product [Rotaria socialis]CAF4509687.1 unnamed protein product [Rotaria socialis]CAF4891358.1 unnamed protein product [Rotaria socialis]
MECRLDEFSSRLSSQLWEIEKKINESSNRQGEIESLINAIVLPSIQDIDHILSQSSTNRTSQESFKKFNEKIKGLLSNRQSNLNHYYHQSTVNNTDIPNSNKNYLPLLYDLSEHQKQIAFETLQECCWTWKSDELSNFWQNQHCQPKTPVNWLSLLHYNIRYFNSNQADLIDMVHSFSPSIISLNELEGTNSHGGVVLAVNKRLKSYLIEINEPNVIAARITIENEQFIVASIYSPPTEPLPLSTMTNLWKKIEKNRPGRILANWLNKQNLKVLNNGTRTSLRSNTTIDLVISSEIPETTESHTLPYMGSDHLPVFTKFLRLHVLIDMHIVPCTYWKLYSSILTILFDQIQTEKENSMNDSINIYNWFLSFERFLAALKLRVTEWKGIKRKRPSISSSLRILIRHKHYLQNRYRHSKYEDDRIRLRSWNILVKQEFQAYRQRKWEKFISNVASSNPTSSRQTMKMLNKKKSVDFSALTDKKEVVDVWKLYSLADIDDIELTSSQSDLKFSVQDIKGAIRSLRSKKSSGFDQVSNIMIKLLPEHYHALLTQAYNDLFRNAQWGSEWKTARTICLNKSENPAPTTNQLRLISMLSIFSKIYERLFLTRFNSWTTRMIILPAQQSGARPHQATTSRVNCFLEQITQSLLYNSFTPVVCIDFLQAFDKLWQQGLLLNLYRLNCPAAYLV